MAMPTKPAFIAIFVLTSSCLPLGAATAMTNADALREYEQVKKIAQRDPKVRAAYEAADARLEEKILQLDPALEGWVKAGKPTGSKPAAPAPHAAQPSKGAAPEPKAKAAPASRSPLTHTIKKGETLGEIAAKYHVSATELRTLNGIEDERRLIVGQVLNIPSPAPVPAKKKSFW